LVHVIHFLGGQGDRRRVQPDLGVAVALHQAFPRYHDANNWPMLREALRRMGRADLIGPGKQHLVPPWQPAGTGQLAEGARKHPFRTQHTRPRGGGRP
ncbi:MAG: DUF3362 domain-containing protein, partial [bacterium]